VEGGGEALRHLPRVGPEVVEADDPLPVAVIDEHLYIYIYIYIYI
jgi:hypothetical protein